MAVEPTDARKSFGDIAPKLAEISDKVLFGDVWADTTLNPRDRSLVTITSLISLYRTNELPFHLKRALENGLTRDEIVATITHLAFYAGWPPAMTGLQIARKVFEDAGVYLRRTFFIMSNMRLAAPDCNAVRAKRQRYTKSNISRSNISRCLLVPQASDGLVGPYGKRRCIEMIPSQRRNPS